jgi:2-polyprenyl-3-methyl-5-hydroxy-6-metoxy-1,4-benzoquinol methylase
MMLISEEYRALNRELHERNVSYGVSGHRWAPTVETIMHQGRYRSMLDYGCGSGSLKSAIMVSDPPFRISEYDPAIPGKDHKPVTADLVTCGDVLEHIEPELLDAVLDHIQSLAIEAVFLIVSTVPAKKTLADGRNAHLIVKPASWWLERLLSRWNLQRFDNSRVGFIASMTVEA